MTVTGYAQARTRRPAGGAGFHPWPRWWLFITWFAPEFVVRGSRFVPRHDQTRLQMPMRLQVCSIRSNSCRSAIVCHWSGGPARVASRNGGRH